MLTRRVPRPIVVVVAAVGLVLVGAGCTATGGGARSGGGGAPSATSTTTTVVSIDATLTRNDVGCRGQRALGGDDVDHFVAAAYVVGGKLGATCFGERDPSLIAAWKRLAAIAPPSELRNLALFAGYTSTDDTDLAFVNALDDPGRRFQMSVNLDAFDDDVSEAQLTMAHEFAHVFTGVPDQIDRSVGPDDPCSTWFEGEGCYRPTSIMAAWIDAFWTADELASIDPDHEPDVSDGERLCNIDPGFLGAYSATRPDEDFAETFAAYVYRVEAPAPEVQDKFDWMDRRPELAAFRERAIAADLGPLEGDFETCGN